VRATNARGKKRMGLNVGQARRVNGRMFIRIQPVKYARGMNNAVTIYNCIQGLVIPAVSTNKCRKDQLETIKLFVL